jgi:RNA-DNA + DNA-DNA helicase
MQNVPSKLVKHMNKIPQYQLLPRYPGIPTPEVFLDSFVSKKTGEKIHFCPIGLWYEVVSWCKSNNEPCDKPDSDLIYSKFDLTEQELEELVNSWNLSIQPRDYQIKAAWKILKYTRSLSLLATRAGKTLIGYIVFRAAMEKMGVKRILMIVPSIQLVKQGHEDFKSYAEFFNGEEVWAKGEEVSGSNLTIGTFNSLVNKLNPTSKRYNPDYFKGFDLVCVDEAHKLKAKSIKNILSQPFMKEVKIQFGFTGTLPKPNTIDWLCCQAMMGPKIQDISTMELVNKGFLIEPIIKQFRLKYNSSSYLQEGIDCAEYLVGNYVLSDGKKQLIPKKERVLGWNYVKQLPPIIKEIKKKYSKENYYIYLQDWMRDSQALLNWEQEMAQHSKPKLDLICDLLRGMTKNCIVFAHNTDYIGYLVKTLKDKFPNRKVLKIDGGDNLKKRQKVLDEMLADDGCILVASLTCVATGLTFKRVENIIYSQSMKSEVMNMQSVGRILLPENKDKKIAYVYDIIDQFETKRLYNQGLAKIREYKLQKYKYCTEEISCEYSSIYEQDKNIREKR